jgi:hypothetical protein
MSDQRISVESAVLELRGHQALYELYEQMRSGLYDPDGDGDPDFDPSDFSDGLDPNHPAPAADLFDPAKFDDHECDWGSGCPYRGGPGMAYLDDEPDDDLDDEAPNRPERCDLLALEPQQ